MLNGAGRGVGRVALAAWNARPLWLALGIANLLAGIVIALRPGQSQDLLLVAHWCREWFVGGVSPYPGPAFTTNYPPYTLAFLFPLALVPERLLGGAWAVSNAALAALVGWLGVRLTPFERRRHDGILTWIGFFLAWESVRVGLGIGQFTLLAVACGLAAVTCRGTIWRGLFLSFAMIKPQVGVAFALWAMLDGSLLALAIAALPLTLGTVAFAARLGQSPLQVVASYGSVLRHQMSGPAFKQGSLELRPLVRDLIVQPAIADAVHVGLIAGMLVLLIVAYRRMSPANRALFLLPLTCLWTLMSVYHPTYDMVLLWPVSVAMSNWQAHLRPRAIVVAAVVAVQLALVVDIPGLWWKLNGRSPIVAEGTVGAAIQHVDRLLVLALFAALIAVSSRWQSAGVSSLSVPRHAVPAS